MFTPGHIKAKRIAIKIKNQILDKRGDKDEEDRIISQINASAEEYLKTNKSKPQASTKRIGKNRP